MRVTSQELKSLRDMAKSAGQLSAAISGEVKREELRRFYVKQIEPAHVYQLSKMSDRELQRFIRETDALIRSMEPSVPPAGRHSGSCINSAWRSGCSGDHLMSLRITCCAHLVAERCGWAGQRFHLVPPAEHCRNRVALKICLPGYGYPAGYRAEGQTSGVRTNIRGS
jgi:DNA-binding transcriptional regulator YdaS (Cro superfamily)